jgi:hypothetical protein
MARTMPLLSAVEVKRITKPGMHHVGAGIVSDDSSRHGKVPENIPAMCRELLYETNWRNAKRRQQWRNRLEQYAIRSSGPYQRPKSLPAIFATLCVLSGSIKMKPLAGSGAASRRCWTMPPIPMTLATSTRPRDQATAPQPPEVAAREATKRSPLASSSGDRRVHGTAPAA